MVSSNCAPLSTALGIILIRNVPHFSAYRVRLLPMASTLAHSPATTLAELEDEQSQYMFGWSHGKELVNGKRDVAKGSFYANPVHDVCEWDVGGNALLLSERMTSIDRPCTFTMNDDLPETH